IPCTSLCSIAGTLMRRTSPCTRIIGGRPEDRCRSDALFLTTKASSSVRSITIPPGEGEAEIGAHFLNVLAAYYAPGFARRTRWKIMAAIDDNLQAVAARIRHAARAVARDPSCVQLLAV